MPKRAWAAILALACLIGCTDADAVDGPVGIGQTAYVGGPLVTPDHVVEDTRCPARTTCVWPGRVVVRATVSGGAWSRTIDLMLGVPADVADGKLTLVAVTPERRKGRSAKTTPSRFVFSFRGGV